MKKWIVFDIDDVICNFRESLYQSFKAIGKDIHWTEWETYQHTKIYGYSKDEELFLHMASHQVVEKAEIEQEVFDLFHRLKEQGYHIGLLTARGWHNQGYEITEQFVNKYNLPVDKIVISGQHLDKKSDHIPQFDGQIVAYIDDSIHHIQDFTDKSIPAFLMNRPWNIKNEHLPRVLDLLEFEQKIKSLEYSASHSLKP